MPLNPLGSRRPILILLAAAITFATLLVNPNHAFAGDYTQILCANPDTGQGVARDGILPSGFSSQGTRTIGAWISAVKCGARPMPADGGLVVNVSTPFTTSAPGDGAGALIFSPPPGVDLVAGDVYVVGSYGPRNNHMGFAVHGGDWGSLYSSPSHMVCEWYTAACPAFDFSSPWASGNHIHLTAPSPTGFEMTLACAIPDSGYTCAGDSTEYARFYGGKVMLRDYSDPQVTQPPFGGLLADNPLRGLEDATANATDTGSGVYRMEVLVDGQLAQSQVVDANGGACADVNPANSDPYEFADGQPCKLSAGGTVQLDTTAVPEGIHTIGLRMEDASGNRTTIASRSVTVDNVPDQPAVPSTSGSAAGAGLPGGGIAGSGLGADVARGAPNGAGATDAAHLDAVWQRGGGTTLTSRYGARNVARGRLTDQRGAPIRGAVIDVVATAAMRGAVASQQGVVRTGSDGTFSYALSGNASSRRIAFRYRSHVGDATAAAERTLSLSVSAGLSFAVTPRTAHRGSTIRITGRLLGGPYPAHGKVVELQARNPHGRWITFRTIRTRGAGRFATRYTFRRPGPATYQLRARARESGDYPFATGTSRSRVVRVR
jgi:hypothetical protein